jgi:hypothetical protein
VHAHGIDVGAVEQGFVGAGIIGADAIDELVLAQKPAALRLGLAPGGGRGRFGWGCRLDGLEAQ